MMKKLLLTVGLVSGLVISTNAQLLEGLGRKIKDKAKAKIDKSVDKSIGSDKAEDKATGKEEKGSDKPQGLKSYSKFDFVPGEKVLYAEDFSQDEVGELPTNWNATGKGEVVTLDDFSGKWLRLFPGNKYLSGNKQKFGENYTVEFDLILDGTPPSGTRFFPGMSFGIYSSGTKSPTDNYFFTAEGKWNSAVAIAVNPNEDAISKMQLRSSLQNATTFTSEDLLVANYSKTFRKVAHYAIQVQKQRFRFWVNENKIFDIPKAVNTSSPMNQLVFSISAYHPYNESNYGLYISNIKVATGLPDTRNKLITEGKFSTTGILFDSGSDVIKAQSAGVLKEIAQTLKDNPNVKVKIVGHTDSDGNDKSNMELSKQRGAAVKAALEKDYDIDADRLESDGKGESQPVGDNKTKEGKALNRRVEFIKL